MSDEIDGAVEELHQAHLEREELELRREKAKEILSQLYGYSIEDRVLREKDIEFLMSHISKQEVYDYEWQHDHPAQRAKE